LFIIAPECSTRRHPHELHPIETEHYSFSRKDRKYGWTDRKLPRAGIVFASRLFEHLPISQVPGEEAEGATRAGCSPNEESR
jgi:hypothetical protein